MASTSSTSTGCPPPRSPNAPAVGGGVAQQLQAVSSASNQSPGDTTTQKKEPINPLLLASACFGSSDALKFLFEREDAQEGPMTLPTQVFLDKLVGWTEDSCTKTRLTVPQASDDVEHGVYQPVFPTVTSHEAENLDQETFYSAASFEMEEGPDQPDLPVPASEEIVDHPVFPDIEDGNPPSSPTVNPHEIEVVVEQHALPSASNLLKGVTTQGDTALHVVASHGDSEDFLECATIIDTKDKNLMFAVNKKGNTPLHCAARAGRLGMVDGLIKLVESDTKLKSLLRKENSLKETALHDAVRVGNSEIVILLLHADPELASFPQEGTSPLYLAILLEEYLIARNLHHVSKGNLSYTGPHGQNALHIAILRSTAMTEYVLQWKNSLTTQPDIDGSTPLHFASSLHNGCNKSRPWESGSSIHWRSNIFKQVFEANPAPVYKADNKGSFPIHIAASLGTKGTVLTILEKCPSSAGLRDAKGRTFLHVAAAYKKLYIVSFACRTPSLVWILNMQDNDGNTALHLAVKARKIQMFCSLYGNRRVHLSLTNNDGQTPFDIATSLIRPGMFYVMNTDKLICRALALANAKHSGLRWDQIYIKYINKTTPDDKIKEVEKMKESSQMLGVGSVLIASIAFRATFSVPKIYKADVQTNGDTHTLAGKYSFDAFVMATTIAFICSSSAIIGLMYAGTSMVDLGIRRFNFRASLMLMSNAVTSLSAAFALGACIQLASVSRGTAILICLCAALAVLYRTYEVSVKLCILARPLCIRMGPCRASSWIASSIYLRLLLEFWPLIIIFGWPAVASHHRNHV